MSKKLIALDMDGTLLSTDKTISPENKQAIRDAQAVGHVVMICSGRPHVSLAEFLQEEGLADLPISASNGTITLVDDQVINQVVMEQLVVKKVFDWLSEYEYPFNIYTDQGVFSHVAFFERAKRESEFDAGPGAGLFATDFAKATAYFEQIITARFEHLADLPADLGIFKFFVLTHDPAKKAAFKHFTSTLSGLTVTSSYSNNVEVSDARGHKGTGITAVADYFGIATSDTVAMGDNFNDLGMLEVAGLAVAMGNAEADIKAIADIVTLSNDDHGVAHAIREYVL